MTLFKHLHEDAFLVFSRAHRHLYEACLLDLYERFFTGVPRFPASRDVVHAIYDVMRANPSLWSEADDFGEGLPELVSKGRRRMRRASNRPSEAGDKALGIARQIYGRLLATGWLEEEEFGIRVTVDMPMGPLLVLQRLASLNKDVSQRFSGLVINIRLGLEAIQKLTPKSSLKDRGSAIGLQHLKTQSEQFTGSLRAILSDLKRIRTVIMDARSFGDRLQAFFTDFVDQLLLKDFESILTVNHPDRFRDEIVDLTHRIGRSPSIMAIIAEEYVTAKLSPDLDNAHQDAESDLLSIEQMFQQIGEMFERIEAFRRQLEIRVRNTIKYAERDGRGLAGRAGDLVRRFDAILARAPDKTPEVVQWGIEPLRSAWSPLLHAPTRRPRQPVQVQALQARAVDPIHAARKRLRLAYITRLAPRPEDVRRFLEQQVPPFTHKEARFIRLATIDDFLAFDAARRYALTGEIPSEVADHFKLEPAPDTPPHDSEWVLCDNFVVARREAILDL